MYTSNNDYFEGQETLGKEYENENSISSISDDDIYPDALVNISTESQSVYQLFRRFTREPKQIILDPDYQRQDVWNINAKSELIESILMGIPLPLIYVKQDDVGVFIIIDGRQRLTTLFEFMQNKFALKGLKVLNDLNGCYFNEDENNKNKKWLSQQHQGKIEDCQLTLNIIKKPTPDRVTFDLFDRVNRGGVRLNNQEMRNAIYQGNSTQFLNDLAAKENFKRVTGNAVSPKRMKDKYLILRFVAFYLWRKKLLVDVKTNEYPKVEYRSDLEDFLSKAMLFLNDSKSESFRIDFLDKFDKAMLNCANVLGENCFRLPKYDKSETLRPINMALFESMSYMILELSNEVDSKKTLIKDYYNKLVLGENINNKNYVESLTKIVDANISVNNRFEIIEFCIKEIKNA